jgi:hypothetical protein
MPVNNSNTATIGFEQQIWAAADILRGNIDAGEYKHVVLGLIFLKYISDKFEERYQELLADDDDVEDKDAYTEANVFFVSPFARWSVIAAAAHTEEIGTVIDDAMWAIEKENKRLKDILPKNYARGELDKRRLGNVVDLFTNIQMIEHGTNKDILGRAYEYCLSKFAEQEGKRAGEFYTPSWWYGRLLRFCGLLRGACMTHDAVPAVCSCNRHSLSKIIAGTGIIYLFTARTQTRPRENCLDESCHSRYRGRPWRFFCGYLRQ